eukprot:scaffold108513_cov23-Cyclotella_meneghiniana.AAC.1
MWRTTSSLLTSLRRPSHHYVPAAASSCTIHTSNIPTTRHGTSLQNGDASIITSSYAVTTTTRRYKSSSSIPQYQNQECDYSTSTMCGYLNKILNAKVYDVAIETELQHAKNLSKLLNNTVLLKREDTQPVFSFKIRGAYNAMAHLSKDSLERGVVACSAGNHAQGVALSAKILGCRAVICMPLATPSIKVNAVREHG